MKVNRRRFAQITFGVALLAAARARGEDPSDLQAQRRMQLLAEMRKLAELTEVRVGSEKAVLTANPVFRYDDQPRRFIDATMWMWTLGGRPIACQKIEARLHQATGKPEWGYCFTSLAETKLSAAWGAERKYESSAPGIAFQPVPEAPAPSESTAGRRRQARDIARRLSGRILINPKTDRSAEMRLLSRPIFEFEEPESELLRGATFGWETNGTNPDLLVLIEVRKTGGKPAWHFAPARMTTGGITLRYRDEDAWDAPFVSPHDGPFANWLFFATPRTPVAAEREKRTE